MEETMEEEEEDEVEVEEDIEDQENLAVEVEEKENLEEEEEDEVDWVEEEVERVDAEEDEELPLHRRAKNKTNTPIASTTDNDPSTPRFSSHHIDPHPSFVYLVLDRIDLVVCVCTWTWTWI